jgi:hypothetical protein
MADALVPLTRSSRIPCGKCDRELHGGTGAFSKICGEGTVDVKVIQEAGQQPRRVLDYTGVYWFE